MGMSFSWCAVCNAMAFCVLAFSLKVDFHYFSFYNVPLQCLAYDCFCCFCCLFHSLLFMDENKVNLMHTKGMKMEKNGKNDDEERFFYVIILDRILYSYRDVV